MAKQKERYEVTLKFSNGELSSNFHTLEQMRRDLVPILDDTLEAIVVLDRASNKTEVLSVDEALRV